MYKIYKMIFRILLIFYYALQVSGFPSMCQNRLSKVNDPIAAAVSWSDGEVSWDLPEYEDEYYFVNQSSRSSSLKKDPYITLLLQKTPLYKKVHTGHKLITSVNTVFQMSEKEFVGADAFFSQISDSLDNVHTFSTEDSFIIGLLSGFSLLYMKTRDIEMKRFYKLRAFTTMDPDSYKKLRHITTFFFVFFLYILTKNVQSAA